MKKILAIAIVVLFLRIPIAFAQESIRIDITPQPCANRAGCPVDLVPVYEAHGESCVTDMATFASNPTANHLWIEDPEITAQGKADERARQFIYWTLNTRSLDDSPVIKNVWKLTSNITYFLVLFVAALLGIGLIVGQRMRFETKVKVWPTIMKVAAILLYVAFSAAIIILLIQFSEIMMKFFLETLGGKDFFNIYFSTDQNEQINQMGGGGATGGLATGSSENNYIHFVGCRDLNIRVQESVHAEVFLFKATNVTYYVMGTMLLLRKILLWFLLFVAPLAAVLIPFVFIRNVAWIWLGVFFQWLFYGPLFALFLGAIASIWKQGIPFLFDFSRTGGQVVNGVYVGYVYPTAINITYGGPAQRLGALNNGNYVDTFAEYIITLIMLWGAIIFPWWLLRIFRDYCCDYLMAMKNILLNMYDQMRVSGGPMPPSPGQPPPSTRTTSTSQNIVNNQYKTIPTEHKLETMQEIRSTATQQILENVNIAAPHLTDIAKFETNKAVQQTAIQNIELLRNPMKADTPVERQKFMNIRTELFNRALKEDKLAKQVLSSVSTSMLDQRENKTAISNQVFNAVSQTANTTAVRENMARKVVSAVTNQNLENIVQQQNTSKENVITTVLANTPADRAVSVHVQIPQQTVAQVTNSITNSVSNINTINQIAQNSNVDTNTVSQIYQAYQQNSTQSPTQIQQTIANSQSVNNALQRSLATNQQTITQISNTTNIPAQEVQRITEAIATTIPVKQSETTLIENLATETRVEKEKVREVISNIKTHERQGAIGSETVNTIANTTQVPAATVQNIVNKWNENKQPQTQITSQIAEKTQIDREKVQKVINEVTSLKNEKIREVLNQIKDTAQTGQTNTVITQVSQVTQVSQPVIQQILQSWNENITKNPTQIINTITNNSVVNNALQQSLTSNTQTISNVSNSTKVDTENVRKITENWNKQITQAPVINETNIVENIANQTQIQKEKIQQVINQLKTEQKAGDITNQTITNISNTTNVPPAMVTNIANTWNKAVQTAGAPGSPLPPEKLVERISTETNIEREKVEKVVNEINNLKKDKVREVVREVHQQISKNNELVSKIAKQNNIKEEEVRKITEAQQAIVASQPTDQAIEKKITIPSTVSIEDYEAVKKMWQKQYETGEIPVTENIQSRNEWLGHDVVFITNALNKLMSEDETLRQQGLDDISYILPIFMINNFKGEELLVYLKAKLEAAKQVQEQLEREEQLKEEFQKKDEEEQIEVSTKKPEEQAKEMQMQQEMTIDGEEKKDGEDGNGGEQNGSGAGTPPTDNGNPPGGETPPAA